MSTREEIEALRLKLASLERKKEAEKVVVKPVEEEIDDIDDEVEDTYVEDEELEGLNPDTGEREEIAKPQLSKPMQQVVEKAVEHVTQPQFVSPMSKQQEIQHNIESLQRDIERLQNNGIFRVELLFQLMGINASLSEINKKIKG